MARLSTQAWSAHWTLSWQWWQTPRHGKMAVWKVGMKLGVVMKCWIHVDTWIPMIASFWKGHDNLKASLIVGRACCSSGHFHLIVLIPGVCWEVTESVEVSPQVSPVLYNYQKQQSFLLVARAGSTTGGKRTRTHSHTQVVTLCHRSHPYSWQPTIKQHKTVWHHVAVRCSYPCRCCFVAEASS